MASGEPSTTPQGELMLRVIASPADISEKNYIFGGWIMGQMDIAASLCAYRHAGIKVLTVAVNNITFLKPMFVTDEITAYARVMEIKRTSMVVGVELWIRTTRDPVPVLGTTGSFVFVAIDEATWKPVEIKNRNF